MVSGGGSLTESSSGSAANASADSSSSSSKIAPDTVVKRGQSKQSSSLSNPSGTPIDGSSISTLSNNSNGGTYYLTDRVTTSDPIYIKGDTTLDLNGHGLEYKGSESSPTFIFVQNGATLTVTDSNPGTTVETNLGTSDVTGHEATLKWSGNNPFSLTYYVTKSVPNDDELGTTETLYQEQYTPGGFIVAGSSKASAVVNVASGSTFNLRGGLLTLKNAYTAATSSIYPQVVYNAGKFNMSGGYLAGVETSYRGGGVRSVSGSTMSMSGDGVIAANTAVSGGGVYMESGTLNISGGTISGNSVSAATYSTTAEDGYGAGVFAIGSSVTVSGGCYITNNRLNAKYSNDGTGLIGGGGMAVFGKNSAGALTISGGYITGNYSESAGGGVYAGRSSEAGLKTFQLTGGTVAANVAQTSEGGGIRVSEGTAGAFDVSARQKAYITNNKCNSTFDWGGGGVFVQKDGTLVVKNSLITNNTAGGYGGGVAACPSGQTVVTHTQGAAIYGNKDEGANMSGGGDGKSMDSKVAHGTDEASETFRANGHADYFLVRNPAEHPIAAVTGRMLGDGAANWKGSIDGTKTAIDANSGAQAKYMVGLTADPDGDAKAAAQDKATIIFSRNYSHNHGGGIMTNGGLTLGDVEEVKIYPAMTLDATKSLTQDGSAATLADREFTFELLRATSESQKPYWNADGTLNAGGCIVSSEVTNNQNGNIHFKVGEDYAEGDYTYYLVEVPTSATDITFDKTIYRIKATVDYTGKKFDLLGITFKYYEVTSLSVTKYKNGNYQTGENLTPTYTVENNTVNLALHGSQNGTAPTFSNVKAPYESTGSFTPEVKKAVTGGDMKTFTFELFTKDSTGKETQVETATNDSDGKVTFKALTKKAGVTADESTERVALKGGKRGTTTDTYYISEKNDGKTGYTYDTTVYKVSVTWKDNGNGTLTPTVTYKKFDSNGKETSEADNNPTFNNKYAITLPSAGQAGITIAYIAGAAVLAYGVWRLVKARGKSRRGGE